MAKRNLALAQVAAKGDTKKIDALLDAGADINAPADGGSPLHIAITSGSLRGARHLIARGAELDVVDKEELTPLMLACSEGKTKGSTIALALIEAGADVSKRREADGMSALEFAVKDAKPEVVAALIAAGAPVDGPPERLQTPAMLAVRAGNKATLQALIDQGADLSIESKLPWAKGLDCLGIAKLEKRQGMVRLLEALADL